MSTYLYIVVICDLSVGGGDAGLHSLNPGLAKLLRLGLQHAASAPLKMSVISHRITLMQSEIHMYSKQYQTEHSPYLMR